jgi:hypothetical protein
MANENPSDVSRLHLEPEAIIKVWSKYEDVAMHFNDLLMRVRTQALGAVAGILAIAGFLIEPTTSNNKGSSWQLIFLGSIALLVSWLLVFFLDLFYYSRLLWGAVDALLEIEDATGGAIVLSTRIDGRFWRFKGRWIGREKTKAAKNLWSIVAFYLPVSLLLAYLSYVAWSHISGGK